MVSTAWGDVLVLIISSWVLPMYASCFVGLHFQWSLSSGLTCTRITKKSFISAYIWHKLSQHQLQKFVLSIWNNKCIYICMYVCIDICTYICILTYTHNDAIFNYLASFFPCDVYSVQSIFLYVYMYIYTYRLIHTHTQIKTCSALNTHHMEI